MLELLKKKKRKKENLKKNRLKSGFDEKDKKYKITFNVLTAKFPTTANTRS